MTLATNSPITEPKTLAINKTVPTVSGNSVLVAFGDSSKQDVITGLAAPDPVPSVFKLKTSGGHLKIVKTAEDGNISGIEFTVTGTNFNKTAKTDDKGELVLAGLVPGTYTVTETPSDKYVKQPAQTITVENGKTATVSFNNKLDRGDLKIIKTSEDNIVADIQFTVAEALRIESESLFDEEFDSAADSTVSFLETVPEELGADMEAADSVEADKLKNTNTALELGKLYLREDYSGYDPLKAVDYLEIAASSGNSYAQFLLGKLFLQGDVIGNDSELALRYLTEAAENGNDIAMYILGKELLLGENLPKDVSQGFDWLVKAMDSGNQYAKFLLAKEYLSGENIPRYPDIAVQLLEELSADNFEYAEYRLGKLYYQGVNMPQDIGRAVYHFEKAFAVGNEYAAYQLGKIFLNEINDTDKAVFYLKAAADKGNAYAQYQLGKLYLFGNGVEKNIELAYEYLIESAKNGNPYALQLLNSHSKGRGASVAMCSMSLLHYLSRNMLELIVLLVESYNTGGGLSSRIIQLMLDCNMLLGNASVSNIKGASYDLSLGDEYYYDGKIKRLTDSSSFLTIEPYDYAIVSCKESAKPAFQGQSNSFRR